MVSGQFCLGAGWCSPNGGRAGGDTCAPLTSLTAGTLTASRSLCSRVFSGGAGGAADRVGQVHLPGRVGVRCGRPRRPAVPPPRAALSLFPVRASAGCALSARAAAGGQCDAATLSSCAEGEWAIGSDGQMKRHGTGTYKSGDNTYEVRTGLLLPCACAAGQLSRPMARRGRGRTTRWTAKASSRSPAAPCTR